MRPALALLVLSACGGSDFQVPPPPDARFELDLAWSMSNPPPDGGCSDTACGGCSSWANWDGTPSKVGDPCLWKGSYQCMGTALKCTDDSCPTCAAQMKGTVCGADGHTIVELTYSGGTCHAYDFGSALDVCNRTMSDHCVGVCSMNADGSYTCVARCASDDGGGTGCQHMATDTCTSLASC